MGSLEDLRSRNQGGKLDKLVKAMSKTSAGRNTTFTREERYYPERNAEGNASAIIRFLPGLDSEDNPYYVELFQHGFKENGNWYVQNCPSTIGKECPVCLANKDVIGEYGKWDDCPKNVQDYVGNRGRMKGFDAGYYSNILVIKDPANPQNEGKVFKFLFGKHIMNLIMDMAQPQDDGLGSVPDPVDIFNLVEGANFKFIIRRKDDRANYDKCEFEKPSPCPEFDHDSQFPLLPIVDESKFKSYEELETLYNKVMNKTTPRRTAEELAGKESKAPSLPKSETKAPEEQPPVPETPPDDAVGNDDDLSYFQNLANEVKI